MIILKKILANLDTTKYKLANILNGLGIKSASLTVKIEPRILSAVNKILYLLRYAIFCASKCLISIAIWLNPKKQIFRENLASLRTILKIKKIKYAGLSIQKSHDLNTNTQETQDVIFKSPLKDIFNYYSVSEGCKLLSHKIKFFDTNKTLKLTKPKVINNDFHVSEKYNCTIKLPDTYLAEINNTIVIGGTDLILSNNTALYDGLDNNDQYIIYGEESDFYLKKYVYHIKSIGIVNKINEKNLSFEIIKNPQVIDSGIHLVKDHSKNYYHWIVECLPRLSLIQGLDKKIPLLIDEDHYPQSLELLKMFNLDNRDLIKLERKNGYLVKKLYYPSPLSLIKDNVNAPDYSNAVVVAPKAIQFVKKVISKQFNNPKKAFRKLYISRKRATYRKLLNSEEIENFLITQGFEIVYPDFLSAQAQIELFSMAQVIIGPTGAGMVNLIFAPKDCKILILSSNVQEANFRVFHSLAMSLEMDLKFLIGAHTNTQIISPMHSDYSIDIDLLSKYVNSLQN